VFCDRSGNRYAYLSAFFSRAVRAADLVNFRFDDLRHTFASTLAMAGVDTDTIGELLGRYHQKVCK
jgi:integrase